MRDLSAVVGAVPAASGTLRDIDCVAHNTIRSSLHENAA
jgi:hypothetical protein